MKCPNCLTDVDDETTECPTCGARRAYGLDVVESMLGKAALRRQVAGFLLGVTSLTLAQIHVLVTGSHASWSTPGPTLGPLWIEGFLLVAGPGILVVLWADLAGLIMRLRTGPRWFGPRGHRGHVPALARRQRTDTVATPCPACGTPVHATAVSCRACRARRGYRLDARLDGGAIVTDRTQARLALTTWIGGMGLSVATLE
ncbi:hypothetical protein [Roseospira visakhapatnamensis]|uniref:Uncharacterized protein n=1 Tax=Roseospira visakhapatnamensis TaxID=390880 RepID=A0A7W6WBG5_9PROT|nr:hypothetical protein [Roseospira visakhapatnamensis]MBB4268310.1 hypothetical protein [Roseospira visakhapatnamensis]